MEIKLTQEQIENLARPLVKKMPEMIAFYEDPKNMQAYREWYRKKYGKDP